MTKTRDLANLIADSKVGPSEIDTTGTYNMNALQVGGTTVIDSSRNGSFGTITASGGSTNNDDNANILTLNATEHARLLIDTSSTGGHRATLALESNGNETQLTTTGSASYLNVASGDLTLDVAGDIILDANVAVSSDTYLSSASTTGSQITLNSDNTASWLGTRELISFESVGNGADHRTGTLSVKLKKGPSDSALTEFMQINAVSNYTTFTGKLLTTAPSNPELLTNGTFSNGTTGWTAHSSILSVSNGQLSVADNGGYTKAWQAITTVVNEAYELTFTGVSVTGQSLVVGLSGTPVNSNTWGDIRTFAYSSSELPVTHSHVFKATTTTTYISIGSEGSNTAVFDNVSIKKVALDDNQVLTQADLAPQLEGLGLKIDAAGRITKQYQPAFVAYKNSITSGTTGSSTIIGWELTRENTGNHFSTSTNRFTAPVDGMYLFNYQILFQDVANGDDNIHCAFWVNGSQRTYQIRSSGEAANGSVGYGGYLPAQGTMLTRLNASDYVDIRFISSGGAVNIYSGADWSEFSGFLLS